MNSDIISESEILTQLEQAKKEIDNMIESGDYSKITKYTQLINKENEDLVQSNKLPEKEIVAQIATTNLATDLAFASLAKTTALKLSKLEQFLSKIEDRLFSDDTIESLSKSDLLALYQSTRLMRTDAFRMLKEVRKDIDFESLEATLLSLHNKESIENLNNGENVEVKSMLEQLLSSDDFMKAFSEKQKEKLNNID